MDYKAKAICLDTYKFIILFLLLKPKILSNV